MKEFPLHTINERFFFISVFTAGPDKAIPFPLDIEPTRAKEIWTAARELRNAVPEDVLRSPEEMREIASAIEKIGYVTLRSAPLRVQILHEGAKLTNGDRDSDYGPPAVNMAAAGALKKTFREHMRRDISPAELEALDLALTKLGRLATGKPKRDTYVDAAAYIAIAGEIALAEKVSS